MKMQMIKSRESYDSLYFGDSPIFTECKLAVDYAIVILTLTNI